MRVLVSGGVSLRVSRGYLSLGWVNGGQWNIEEGGKEKEGEGVWMEGR